MSEEKQYCVTSTHRKTGEQSYWKTEPMTKKKAEDMRDLWDSQKTLWRHGIVEAE